MCSLLLYKCVRDCSVCICVCMGVYVCVSNKLASFAFMCVCLLQNALGEKTIYRPINPKAVTRNELYGWVCMCALVSMYVLVHVWLWL